MTLQYIVRMYQTPIEQKLFTQEGLQTDIARYIPRADSPMWLWAPLKRVLIHYHLYLVLNASIESDSLTGPGSQILTRAKCSRFSLSFMIGMKLACQPHSKCVNKAWGLIIYYFTGYIALPVLFTRAQKYRKIPLENLHTCSKKTHSRVQGKLST